MRHRRNEEKKKLAAAVYDYKSIADSSQQLGSVEDFFVAETVAWPWQIPSNTGMLQEISLCPCFYEHEVVLNILPILLTLYICHAFQNLFLFLPRGRCLTE